MRSVGPHVVVLSGPNGAGKSTTAPALLRGALRVKEFVNPDVIAEGLSAFEPERVALAAGRVMLARMRDLARRRVNFAFETTLASRRFARWLADLRGTGIVCTWSSSGCRVPLWPWSEWRNGCGRVDMRYPRRRSGGGIARPLLSSSRGGRRVR